VGPVPPSPATRLSSPSWCGRSIARATSQTVKLGQRHAGELLADASVAEHLFRCFSQLQPGGQDRRRLNRLELGLFDGSLDFRPSATGTDNYTRLPQRLDSTPAARRLPVALTQGLQSREQPGVRLVRSPGRDARLPAAMPDTSAASSHRPRSTRLPPLTSRFAPLHSIPISPPPPPPSPPNGLPPVPNHSPAKPHPPTPQPSPSPSPSRPPTRLPSKLQPGPHTLGTRGVTRPYCARIDTWALCWGTNPGHGPAGLRPEQASAVRVTFKLTMSNPS
jgi:hypothetical protein